MKVDIAIGEVFDRITILDLKLENITDSSRLAYIQAEKSMLKKALEDEGIKIESYLYEPLFLINSKIWDTEAGFREKESKKNPNQWSGRNEQSIVVVFPKENYKPGDFVNVKINDCTSATLIGNAVVSSE